jgi:alkylated DNA repair dioxygenase AlkB
MIRTQGPPRLNTHDLGDGHLVHTGRLPAELVFDAAQFEILWAMHPEEYHEIMIHGRLVKTPRWQQAFGEDYHYTGRVNTALPVPEILAPLLAWARATIDTRLNGILVNWYEGKLGHYIGAHRDSTKHMVEGAPIVTLSFGEDRVFRLRPWKKAGFKEFPATAGTVFVMPYDTNLAWTHEVPHAAKYAGRRISVTLRAFETGGRQG